MLSQQKQQNILLTNLQTIQSNLEQSDFETKTKLGTQIEGLERELLLARRKVEMEEERGQKVAESFRGGSGESSLKVLYRGRKLVGMSSYGTRCAFPLPPAAHAVS